MAFSLCHAHGQVYVDGNCQVKAYVYLTFLIDTVKLFPVCSKLYFINAWMLLSLPWAPLVAQLVKNLPAMQETLVLIPGSKRSAGEGDGYPLQYSWVSWVAQLVKNPPAIRETWVWCLGEGNGYPFQYSDLENTMDRIELGVTKSWTPPTFTFLLSSKQFDFAELWVHHYSFSFHLYFEERWASFQKIKPLHSLFFCELYHISVFL